MNRLGLIVILALLVTCTGNRPSGKLVREEETFGLSDSDIGTKVDDHSYYSDLQKSEAAIGFDSSFPLPLSVGKSIDKFDAVPDEAKAPQISQLTIYLGDCRFFLKTSTVQVDRYLLAGQWIKLNEGLPASLPVKIESFMDLNLKLIAKLLIEIPSSQKHTCQNIMSGKKIYLGRFHLNKSKIGFLASPGSQKVVFGSKSLEPRGKKVFLRWQEGAPEPSLLDELDFPATSESAIFRAMMAEKGFYYLLFQPALRMELFDQLVIKIPSQSEHPQKNKVDPSVKDEKILPVKSKP